jgi:hypothetical protein
VTLARSPRPSTRAHTRRRPLPPPPLSGSLCAQAISLFTRAHELLERALGDAHPSTLTVARNLAKLQAAPGDGATPGGGVGGARSGRSDSSGGGHLTPRELADEVSSSLDDEGTFVEQAELVGAHLLRAHVDLACAGDGSDG